jgi:DNA-binding NtrC family response regulator/pSer/pThr/pTyr-binding forkhead associated (FHA) protein
VPELPQTVDAMGGEPGGAQPRAFLVIYPGEDTPSRIVELVDGVEVTFGRTRTATVFIDDERVSRMHTRILRRDERIVVEDLGSRNGTRVNGTRIEAPVVVQSGDSIGVGPALAVVGLASGTTMSTAVGGTSYLDERLEAEMDRSARYHRPLALLMVRIEGEPGARDAAVDRVAAAMRKMDTLAEYAPDEYAVIAPELDGSAARALAGKLAGEVRAASATARTGLASFPEDAATAGELVSQARASLRRARAARPGTGPVPIAPASGPVIVDERSRRVYDLVDRVAGTNMTVLVLGETGVGKELIAEALHRKSTRAGGPLVRLNCASLPETLLESELFGHEKGSFTGADRRKVGYFEAATGGTLFLDEIGEMPASLQSKLLRALERKAVVRVGGTQEVAVDVRLVAATHRDPEEEIRAGRFREDLYFRISSFTIAVPPLRDRRDDILPLAEQFARGFSAELGLPGAQFTGAARQVLLDHAWPGNVRELRNAIERAVVMQTGGVIDVEHLPERVRAAEPVRVVVPVGDGGDMREQIADVERAAIMAALDATGGNQTRAAARLGLSRRALIYKLEKYGFKPPPKGGV